MGGGLMHLKTLGCGVTTGRKRLRRVKGVKCMFWWKGDLCKGIVGKREVFTIFWLFSFIGEEIKFNRFNQLRQEKRTH
jgi:hypothetical protein